MANRYDNQSTLRHLRSKPSGSFPVPQVKRPPSPPSETTEILDTDFDSESQSDAPDDSPRRSLGAGSVTTASTPDSIKTPDSAGLSGFHFHIDDKPMRGPAGPIVFQSQRHPLRLSDGSMEIKSSVEIDLIFDDDDPENAINPFYVSASKPGPERRDTPIPTVANPRTPLQSVSEEVSPPQPDETQVMNWTPQDVVAWMQKLNIDQNIVEKFFINDISGLVLLDLQLEDLKELDIQSFGKRHTLMASIKQLRSSVSGQSTGTQHSGPSEPVSREPTPGSTTAVVGARSCNSTPVGSEDASPSMEINDSHKTCQHRRRRQGVIEPNHSASIVGIEQVIPKMHRCSKGEDCRKWQKQQARIARYPRGLTVRPSCSSVAGAEDQRNAATAPDTAKTSKSDAAPSVVASSDALGPIQATEMPISEKTLQDVQPRDAQENVRHFLKLQRLSRLQPVDNPATPPRETFSSPESDSPGNLSEKLQKLPTLRIPGNTDPPVRKSTVSPNYSGQRTITPSVVRRKPSFHQRMAEHASTPTSALFSPSDYYRQDPHYGLASQTPVSETDVPLTAIPVGPIERVLSQSVPPDMRFGSDGNQTAEPILRPVSTKVENHRRRPSVNTSQRALSRLDEGRVMSPIDTPEDLENTPRAAHCRVNPFSPVAGASKEIIHSGWVKKRKTKNLLGHTWQQYHCALRENRDGTELAVYTDEAATRQDSKALEYIDVDDYAVACSSLASCSKLTSLFKKTVLKRKNNTKGDNAFAFSLIPSPNNLSGFDRKVLFNGAKSHHFAVKSREERIDWMRELMLAKALRRGRESGASLNVNGNAV